MLTQALLQSNHHYCDKCTSNKTKNVHEMEQLKRRNDNIIKSAFVQSAAVPDYLPDITGWSRRGPERSTNSSILRASPFNDAAMSDGIAWLTSKLVGLNRFLQQTMPSRLTVLSQNMSVSFCNFLICLMSWKMAAQTLSTTSLRERLWNVNLSLN